ncbi:hypothetical protein [Pantoea stewartii]|uniref:hypothetical protein n=1 Tax=Pantoea stewartii TaxID=66269 RepID=UPI0021E70F76|nr:hypothetical protein [Pantoea stewartii]UYK98873.1 hypothetical protein NG832_07730 [Pantoea stewartii]
MTYSKDEKLRDTLIGEAALASLEDQGSVTFKSVLENLDAIMRSSDSEEKSRAVSMAISEIKADMAARRSPDDRDDDHAAHLAQDADETSRN